jgi:hypothetical protein
MTCGATLEGGGQVTRLTQILKAWEVVSHQQLDKSFFGTLPRLFGLFLALAFFQTFFSAFLEAFSGLQATSAFLRSFQGFRGFGLFVFSEASCSFPLSIDFFCSQSKESK